MPTENTLQITINLIAEYKTALAVTLIIIAITHLYLKLEKQYK